MLASWAWSCICRMSGQHMHEKDLPHTHIIIIIIIATLEGEEEEETKSMYCFFNFVLPWKSWGKRSSLNGVASVRYGIRANCPF